MENIEDTIKQIVSKQVLKAANALIEAGAIIFSHTDEKATTVVIKDKDGFLHRIKIKDPVVFMKKLSKQDYTALEIAAFLHVCKYNVPGTEQPVKGKPKDAKQRKISSEEQVINRAFSVPNAHLLLRSSTSFPNSSSTWESCNISVELLFKGRYYIGNTNKLRQLRFDETKTGSFSLSDFSSQDKQIIRFLSQYAEADGSGFSLRSDLMAEFLHCLYNFQHFLWGKEQIIIHKESAELVGLCLEEPGSVSVTPALLIEDKTIPLSDYNLVVGKGGIWIGISGEYWWVPATSDIIWLRKFLLSGSLSVDLTEDLSHYPIKILKTKQALLKEKTCEPCYYLNFTGKKELTLSVEYKYGDTVLPIASGKIAKDSTSYWKRDKSLERSTENNLLRLGFKWTVNDDGVVCFTMQDTEGIGLFLDKVYPRWLKDSRRIFIIPGMPSVYSKVKPLTMLCTTPSEVKGFYKFNCKLTGERGETTWKQLAKHVKEKREYIQLNTGVFSKISPDLSALVLAFDHIVKVAKSHPEVLQIPKAAIVYWAHLGKKVFKGSPVEWENFDSMYDKHGELRDKRITEPKVFCGELRSYQKIAVNWMNAMIKNDFNVILADEMGLGKTIQALAFVACYKHKISKSLPCIVVCPTSLVENWYEEAEKFTPGLKKLIIGGADRDKALKTIGDYDLVITSYALIKRDIEKYSKHKFGLLILDEAQHIKNPTTINAKVCKSITSKHRLVLTGTPLENSPEDIWSIFDFLNPGMLGPRQSFRTSYSKIENDYKKQKELAERIEPFILRRHKKDVEQLPEKIEQTLYCDMLDTQRDLYDSILREGKIRYRSFFEGKTTRFDILTSLLRLRQLCCHPNLLPDVLSKGVEESAKTELLKELLLETIDSGQKTLVFSQFTSLLSILKGWLDEKNILYEYLDGTTKNRLERVDNFNKNKDISLFLLSLKAGGVGLNLTGADTVIIYDPWWNPSVEAQATDRTHRIGQTKQITSIKLVMKDSIEEKILDLQAKKQGLFDGIIESSSSFKKLSDKDINYLLS